MKGQEFREAAEKQLAALASEFFNSDDMTIHDLTREAFDVGYSEAKKEVREWIPVSERLPEIDEHVLIEGGIAYISRSNNWYTITGVEYPGRVVQWKVTHWMPLPEPPKP